MVNYTPKFAKVESKIHQQTTRQVGDIMLEAPIVIDQEMLIMEAVSLLIQHDLTGAPVIDSQNNMVGFLSEKDCLKFNLDMKYYNDCPGQVKDYMSSKLITLNPTDSLLHVVELFLKNNFQVYPVVEHETKLLGVITRKQILKEVNKLGQTTW